MDSRTLDRGAAGVGQRSQSIYSILSVGFFYHFLQKKSYAYTKRLLRGPHVCIGKHLALNQLRLVIAKIIYNFQVTPGKSYDDGEFLRGVKDYFVAQPGPLPLRFIPREIF